MSKSHPFFKDWCPDWDVRFDRDVSDFQKNVDRVFLRTFMNSSETEVFSPKYPMRVSGYALGHERFPEDERITSSRVRAIRRLPAVEGGDDVRFVIETESNVYETSYSEYSPGEIA